jgi:peptidoglycan/LPS O-acetylase OafA/YrhL
MKVEDHEHPMALCSREGARFERITELDAIRGLAALTIVFFHLWLDRFGILGSAVDLFFVLSGYLITTIILNNTLDDRFLVSFYIRRGLRIWPIYYLVLLALVFVYPLLPTRETLAELPFYLTFTQEIPRYQPASGPTFPSAFRHTWSLAIEEQFYLIWPPLLWWLGKRRLPRIAIALVGLAVAARTLNFSSFILITHCDGLALGGLLAGILRDLDRGSGSALRLRSGMAAMAAGSATILGALIALPMLSRAIEPAIVPAVIVIGLKPLALNALFFAIVGLIVLHAGNRSLAWLRDRRLVYLGTISYGIYLYHHFIFEIWKLYERHYGWPSNMLCDFVKLGASIALAALSWKFIEQPVLLLKHRFGYKGAASRPSRVRTTVDELKRAGAG